MSKQLVLALAVFDGGPAHCWDLSDELGLSMKTASALLSELFAAGALVRNRKVIPTGRRRQCWLYELPPRRSALAAEA